MALLPAIELESPPGADVNAAVIWLHGLGADGNDFAPLVPQLQLSPHYGIRFIFPHAPSIPITINNGYVMPAWYDIVQMDVDRHVDEQQLLRSAAAVHGFIDQEIARGVPSHRIVVAGFSQGGAVAYQAALTYPKTLAGIMGLSTYFPTADSIEINAANSQLPIQICHGTLDPMVAESLGLKSKQSLEAMGLAPEYHSYQMEHAVCQHEIVDIGAWLVKVLQESE